MSIEQRAKVVSVTLLAVIAVGVGAALMFYSTYAELAQTNKELSRAYRDVEAAAAVQRDLVPDLLEVARQATLIDYPQYGELAEISHRLGTTESVNEGIAVQNRFVVALDRVISVADSYPQLRAGQDYATILENFRLTEGQIAIARQRFNEAAHDFNSTLETFPGNLMSGLFDISRRPTLKQPRQL